MLRHNAIATIKRLTGDENNKTYTDYKIGVGVLLMALGLDVAIMFDVPTGQLYSYMFMNGTDSIQPMDKIVISDPGQSGLSVNDVLIVKGEAKKALLMGNTAISGICIRQ